MYVFVYECLYVCLYIIKTKRCTENLLKKEKKKSIKPAGMWGKGEVRCEGINLCQVLHCLVLSSYFLPLNWIPLLCYFLGGHARITETTFMKKKSKKKKRKEKKRLLTRNVFSNPHIHIQYGCVNSEVLKQYITSYGQYIYKFYFIQLSHPF